MDAKDVDAIARFLSGSPSRRRVVGAVAAAFGLLSGRLPRSLDARKRKRQRRKRKKVRFNDFGCVNVGGSCQNAGQCCSGICQGTKGRKRCRAHTTDTCQAGVTGHVCGGESVTCTNADGGDGTCYTTTGNAPYCLGSGDCFPCAKDADCVPFCGPEAACIPCGAYCPTEGTMCAGPSIIDACAFPP